MMALKKKPRVEYMPSKQTNQKCRAPHRDIHDTAESFEENGSLISRIIIHTSPASQTDGTPRRETRENPPNPQERGTHRFSHSLILISCLTAARSQVQVPAYRTIFHDLHPKIQETMREDRVTKRGPRRTCLLDWGAKLVPLTYFVTSTVHSALFCFLGLGFQSLFVTDDIHYC
ncbi:hypothetical protein F5884DRAFT_183873 [Xylogone sp. PMI_703]|nr:hypothetical protein F5884DRAFT_183873 [Xylogone sp. PMI_703]